MTEQEELLKRVKDEAEAVVRSYKENSIDKTTFESKLGELNERIAKIDISGLKSELENEKANTLRELENLKGMIENRGCETKVEPLRLAIRKMLSTQEYTDFANRASGNTGLMKLRDISFGSNYTGTNLVTVPKRDKLQDVPLRKAHIRDLISVSTSEMSSISANEVTSFTDNAAVVAENGSATTSAMAVAEQTWTSKRLQIFVDNISKKMLKNVKWLENYLMQVLPARLLFVEDAQIILGDNLGNNLKGLKKTVPVFTLEGPTFAAGKIASVSSYDSGNSAKITFSENHKIKAGYNITIANATATGYNTTFAVNVLDANSIVIGKSYVAEADTSAWTATTMSPAYHSIDNANEYDVLVQAIANAYIGEYMPTGGIIHPQMGTKILDQLKTAVEFDYLKVKAERRNGFLYISDVPFVETTACPINEFYVGDFSAANLELAEFSGLEIQFATDVTHAKQGQVAIICEEEIIFPIYNKYLLQYGNFTTAKALLETA